MPTDLTKQQRAILTLLILNDGREVHISDITNDKRFGGLGIKGYTERITELRQKGYNIVNTRKNYYSYKQELKQPSQQRYEPVKPEPFKPVKLEGEALNAWERTRQLLREKTGKNNNYQESMLNLS